ncbi:MAG: hypothetical protein H7836_13695 [Magnetococcus sp. YQC-3]
MIPCRGILLVCLTVALGMLLATPVQAATAFRQPAYITNAYFSDQISEQADGSIRPMSAVKALRNRPSGLLGYLILDLMLVKRGAHSFRVEIINQQGEKVGELTYPPVEAPTEGSVPLYTIATPITGLFSPGLWFFKVFDRLNNGTWSALDTFGVMVLDPEKIQTKP